jgi:hypothetical protein
MAAAAAACLVGTDAALADDATLRELEALRRGQEQMSEKMSAQDARIRELETQLRMARGGGAEGMPADSTLGTELDKFLRARDITGKGTSRFKFYGFVRMDAIWDDSRPSNTQTIGWVRSEDAAVVGGAKKNDGDLAMHPRHSRFGFDLDAGTVASLNNAKVSGKIEVDFYNSGLTGQSESRAAIRMRHAYVKMAWENTSVLAGQTSDLISPLFPSANHDLLMWGAGNLGDRRPQVRLEHTNKTGEKSAILFGLMLGNTGAQDNQNIDANGFRDGEASGLPTVQARIAHRFPMGEGAAEFGIWGHRAWEQVDTVSGRNADFHSVAVGFDFKVPFGKTFTFMGEGWKGRNLDDVRGGIFQGINATGREIHSQGGWAELGWARSKVWAMHGGYTVDNPDNGDVGAGGRAANRVGYVGVRWNYDPVEFGIDYMRWVTDFVDDPSGRDNRIQTYVSFKF